MPRVSLQCPPPSPPTPNNPNAGSYVTALAASITPPELAAASKQLLIVGCGEHSVIAKYAAATRCPFEIYSDPSGELYDVLGMGRSLVRGNEPAYIRRNFLSSVLTSIGQGFRWGVPLGGGDIQRVSILLDGA